MIGRDPAKPPLRLEELLGRGAWHRSGSPATRSRAPRRGQILRHDRRRPEFLGVIGARLGWLPASRIRLTPSASTTMRKQPNGPDLVMEHVPGENLAERMSRAATSIAKVGARAGRRRLDIHAAGIVHRDVEPEYVLIAPDGSLKLIDFGIALPKDATSLTQTGNLLGTARYIAPEAMRGEPRPSGPISTPVGSSSGTASGRAGRPRLGCWPSGCRRRTRRDALPRPRKRSRSSSDGAPCATN